MTQPHSAFRPLPAGPEHRLKSIPLAVHTASASSWGRPWRKHSLGLPAPRALTFKGLRLPAQALRSWLHLLARAGMLGARPVPASILSPPLDDDDVPQRIQDLGFEFSSEMILDFAQLARQSRLKNEEGAAQNDTEVPAPELQIATLDPSPNSALEPLTETDSVSPDCMDQVFLDGQATGAESAPIAPEQLSPATSIQDAPPAVEAAPAQEAAAPAVETEAQARHARRMNKLYERFVAKAAGQSESDPAEPAGLGLSASGDAGPEWAESVVAHSGETDVPAESGISASRDMDGQEAFETVQPMSASLDEPAVSEAMDPHEQTGVPAPELAAVAEPVTQAIAEAVAVLHPESPADETPSAAVEVEAFARALDETVAAEGAKQPSPTVSDVPAMAPELEPLAEQGEAPVVTEATGQAALAELEEIAIAVSKVETVSEPGLVQAVEPPASAEAGEVAEAMPSAEAVDQPELLVVDVHDRQIEAEADVPAAVRAVEQPESPMTTPEAVMAEPEAEDFFEQTAAQATGPAEIPAMEELEPVRAADAVSQSLDEVVAVELDELTTLRGMEAREEVAAAVPAKEPFVGPPVPASHGSLRTLESEFVGDATVTESAQADAPNEWPEVAMQWEPVDRALQPELEMAGSLAPDVPVETEFQLDEITDDDSFDPMISSLEDALALLAATNGPSDVEPRRKRTDDVKRKVVPVFAARRATPAQRPSALAESDGSLAAIFAKAFSPQMTTHSNLEAVALQGILIQKEFAMSETLEVVTEAEGLDQSVPITSSELQEVAATLSVPKLEADPDDVLSDVQNTLNSLAGMAQGLTQQKQAAGRLQDELEEWNSQLLERERLASDKEERLAQLDSHLLEAKTNLDRLAAENNRLLTERSEALKQLAHSVDQRDRSTLKRAEAMQVEQLRNDELAASLRARSIELDERESSLKRKGEELAVRLKQLQSAKDKFSAIVKSFNETVQFNTTLSAISKSVTE
ncbi:hypothetical protein HNP46_003073 [Pseudomonas nitritireducens]|uniref:Uncharacterized protein n=1 Tax=Pseudomonas nitroreducens TaxID=46680 RepID=A0A7W7KK31_PSENT|nr:hypothetical protein [Pseudomonas nitritireducens]MBB4864209.1 hypothetical protein [Pseudomonas nitritireducens]